MSFWIKQMASFVNWNLDSAQAYGQWGWGAIPVQNESEGLEKPYIDMVLLYTTCSVTLIAPLWMV